MAMIILGVTSIWGVVFLTLKILGIVDWNWIVILSPYIVMVASLIFGVWYYNRG